MPYYIGESQKKDPNFENGPEEETTDDGAGHVFLFGGLILGPTQVPAGLLLV